MENPIGIFDSGIGGLTVARSISNLLPNENIIYFGDTAHTPWGDKSKNTIYSYCKNICNFLLDKGCKVIVIACNTASALLDKELIEYVGNRAIVLNVIEPMVNYVNYNYQDKVLGLIGTRQTIASNVYQNKLEPIVKAIATPLLVPLIEEGLIQNDVIADLILKEYLSVNELKNIDALILGCTHYPILSSKIKDIYKEKVDIINSCNIMPYRVKDILKENNILNKCKGGNKYFYVSDNSKFFLDIANKFFAKKIKLECINFDYSSV